MSEALTIFARFPRLGEGKTRLSRVLTDGQRHALSEAFLLDTVERTAQIPAERFLYLAGGDPAEGRAMIDGHLADPDLSIQPQRGVDLGERLWLAARQLLTECTRIVFIGADSPTLPLAYVKQAFDLLARTPIVIGPGEDGGYYLLGLREARKELFVGIDWGSERVLEQTVARLEPGDYSLLPLWYDVDRPADLDRLRRDLESCKQDVPWRTRRLLQSFDFQGPSQEHH